MRGSTTPAPRPVGSFLVAERLRDPRVRLLLVVVLALASFALVWHLVGMADHSGDRSHGEVVMLAVCFAVAAATLLVVPPPRSGSSPRALVQVCTVQAEPRFPPAPGRHPPDDGSVLRL